jgi:hypothetical protein
MMQVHTVCSRSGNYGAVGIPSCVGPIPPVVITKSYFCTMRLLASILRLLLLSSRSAGESGRRTFRPPRPVLPQCASCQCHPVSEKGDNDISRTIQCHSRSNNVQSSLSSGPAFSRSESHHFYKHARGRRAFGCQSKYSRSINK